MIEPLAAGINGIVSRASPSPSGARVLKLALGFMGIPSRRSFPSDFFSPVPRQWKGKEKATEPQIVECKQCWLPPSDPMASSSCNSKHSPWCPMRNRLFMMNEVIPLRSQHSHQAGAQRYMRRHSSSSAAHLPFSHTFSSDSSQPAISHEQDDPTSHVRNLRALLAERKAFDVELAWNLYTASLLTNHDQSMLTPTEQLVFAEQLSYNIRALGDAQVDLQSLHTWGVRLEPLLRDLNSILEDGSPESISLKCLSAQVSAWLGDLAQATQLAHEIRGSWLSEAEKGALLSVYRDILTVTRHQRGSINAFKLLAHEWNFLGPFYSTETSPSTETPSFRKMIHGLFADIPDGASLLSSSELSQAERLHMGELLLEAYCAENLCHKAHALVLEMRNQQLPLRFHLQTQLIRILARRDLFVLAHDIFTPLDPSTDPRIYYATGLYLYSRQGDVDRAEHFFHKLGENDSSMRIARRLLMHAYAVAGQAERVVELFHKFFPDSPNAERPLLLDYTTVILAYAEQANIDDLNLWLEKMINVGYQPDAHVYSIILEGLAKRGEVHSLVAVFDQMLAAGVKPDQYHFTSIISLLARRKDPPAAEAVFQRALQEGIAPDHVMVTSLMNAHVEAGSWDGVVRLFDYLHRTPNLAVDLSISVYNTLLKAYVLIGAPFHVVFKTFRRIQELGLRPDGHTYALVIQSACDAGKMNEAEDLFTEMENAKSWATFYHSDAYVLTILMAGYVRRRLKGHAKDCYEEMLRRGIKPGSVAYKQIVQAYANDRTEESLEIAESFVKQVMDEGPEDPPWMGPLSRSATIGNIHSPLMLVYAKQEKPEDVERLLTGMLEAGGVASLHSLTIVLDVHRRKNNVEAVRQLWPRIVELALENSHADAALKRHPSISTPVPRRPSNILSMPLSIYIDSLSAAGDHHAVLDAWTKAKEEGFSFDAHNWNHLAVALVRAGELERAFEVLERVLIPLQRRIPTPRDTDPDSPLVFHSIPPDVDIHAAKVPVQRNTRRAQTTRSSGRLVKSRVVVDEDSVDFAHPLHILHQVIPGLSVWRPHNVTLQVLFQVLGHLHRGHLVQPVAAPDAPPRTPQNAEEFHKQAEIAKATLQRIHEWYPTAVRAVMTHEIRRNRRAARKRSVR